MTIAESLYPKWNADRLLRFRTLCERFKRKYSYECDVLNLRFTHIYTFEDGSSLAFGSEYLERNKTNYFCEVKNG